MSISILYNLISIYLLNLPIDFLRYVCYNEIGCVFNDNGDVFNIISEYEKIKHEQIL